MYGTAKPLSGIIDRHLAFTPNETGLAAQSEQQRTAESDYYMSRPPVAAVPIFLTSC
jgi:hypothetical protein